MTSAICTMAKVLNYKKNYESNLQVGLLKMKYPSSKLISLGMWLNVKSVNLHTSTTENLAKLCTLSSPQIGIAACNTIFKDPLFPGCSVTQCP